MHPSNSCQIPDENLPHHPHYPHSCFRLRLENLVCCQNSQIKGSPFHNQGLFTCIFLFLRPVLQHFLYFSFGNVKATTLSIGFEESMKIFTIQRRQP